MAEPLHLGRGNAAELTVVGSKAYVLVNDNGTRLTLVELAHSPLSITREILLDDGPLGWTQSIAALADGSLIATWASDAPDFSWLIHGTALCPNGAAAASPITLATVGNNFHQRSMFLAPSGSAAELVYAGGPARTTALARAITLSVEGCSPAAGDAGAPVGETDAGAAMLDAGMPPVGIDAGSASSDEGEIRLIPSGGGCGCRGVAHDRSSFDAVGLFPVLFVLRARARRRSAAFNRGRCDVRRTMTPSR
jgi:hypothetical protein